MKLPTVLGSWFAVAFVCSGCTQLMAPVHVSQQRSTTYANPLVQTSSLFYPLDIGNHWSYEQTLVFVIVPTGGTPGPPATSQTSFDVDLIGTQQYLGRDYVVQRETFEDGSQGQFLYRQDKSGLYNADVAPAPVNRATQTRAAVAATRLLGQASEAQRSAYRAALDRLMNKQLALRRMVRGGGFGLIATATGPLQGEIALLQYPLATSKTWHVREDPLVIYTVEGQDRLDLPAGALSGWRIRIEWPGVFGPNDRAQVWYGRDGVLQLEAHLEGEATDENGNVIGTIISDESQRLTDHTLVNSGS